MIRFLNIAAVLALIGSAIYAYSIKYQTIFHAEKVADLRAQIKKEHDQIGLLRAEWAHLTRPERVQALTDRLTELKPLNLNQIVRLDALPDKAPAIDTIGRKLEDLGLSQPTTTPGDAHSGAVTPGSARKVPR